MSDWIEWTGGNCPVRGDTLVEVRIRGGDVVRDRAREFWWDHQRHLRASDILAYRVVQAAKQPAPSDGWIEQAEGMVGRTVPFDTLVEVRTADGTVGRDVAGAFDWSTVEAYRVGTEGWGGVSAVDTLRKAAYLIEQRGRQRDGEKGERSMARTVAAFNAIYGTALTETQGWHFMELLKMVRSSQGCYVADDFEDKVAYAALAAECEAGARGRDG